MDAKKSVSSAMEVIMKPPVYFFIVAIIIVKLLLLKYMPTNVLIIYRALWFRIAFAILIALFAAYDYILATLLVACYVLAIQELNNRDLSANTVTTSITSVPSPNSIIDSIMSIFAGSSINKKAETPVPTMDVISKIATMVKPLENTVNTDGVNYTMRHMQAVDLVGQVNSNVDQSNAVPAKNLLAEIGNTDIAFSTLTENLMANGFENLTLEQLNMPASNLIAGVDPDKPISSGTNILDAQGLELKFPTGFDKCSTMSSKC